MMTYVPRASASCKRQTYTRIHDARAARQAERVTDSASMNAATSAACDPPTTSSTSISSQSFNKPSDSVKSTPS